MMSVIYVFIGGGLGSLCRFGIAKLFPLIFLPKGTFIANLISCLVLGFLLGINSKIILAQHQRLFFMTGFCGGFSTFSTFSAEILELHQNGTTTLALSYVVLSILGGVSCLMIGLFLSRLVN